MLEEGHYVWNVITGALVGPFETQDEAEAWVDDNKRVEVEEEEEKVKEEVKENVKEEVKEEPEEEWDANGEVLRLRGLLLEAQLQLAIGIEKINNKEKEIKELQRVLTNAYHEANIWQDAAGTWKAKAHSYENRFKDLAGRLNVCSDIVRRGLSKS